MAQIGPSITLGSIGPSGTPDIAFSNLFAVFQSPWGIDSIWQTCSSFQDFLRLYGGLNKLTAVASGTTADTYYIETTADVVQGYYAIKGYFDEKQAGSPGVLYACRVCKSSSGPTAASKTFADQSANNTTVTSKWKGRDGATTQITTINPSPRKGVLTLQTGTVSTTASSTTVTGSGTTFVTGSTWVGWGIQLGPSTYGTIASVTNTTALELAVAASATASGLSFAVGNNTTSFYLKAYHPQSGITEEWDIANATDAADVSKKSQLITVTLPAGGQLPSCYAASKLNSGSSATADPYTATDADYVGTTSSAGVKTGLQVFNEQRLGSGFVAIPGKYSATIRAGIATHAAAHYRQGILGSGPSLTQTTVVTDLANRSGADLSYYWPQIWVANQNSDSSGQILVDPVGHIAGLGARMDRNYGSPHKSPAGTLHPLVSALDVERGSSGYELCDDAGSNTLADQMVNTIRIKGSPRSGVTVWGLRTLANDNRYRQINVRRIIQYIYLGGLQILEKYIMDPFTDIPITSGPGLIFGKVKADLDGFLESIWQKGGLYGAKPGKEPQADAAWFVTCDVGNNPGVQVGSGELHADIAVVPAPNIERITVNLYAAAPGFVGKQQ